MQISRHATANGQDYSVLMPDTLDEMAAVPLILALHYSGDTAQPLDTEVITELYGPAWSKLGVMIVAPRCTGKDWTQKKSQTDTLQLLDELSEFYPIDPRRTLITGYSLGAAGVWSMLAQHPDRFAAALPISGEVSVKALNANKPIHVIHSAADEVISYSNVEKAIDKLKSKGADIRLTSLKDTGHYQTNGFVSCLKKQQAWVKEILDL